MNSYYDQFDQNISVQSRLLLINTKNSKYNARKNSIGVRAPFFNTCFDKGQVKNLVSWFLETYGEKSTIDFLESVKYLGFHQATLAGISLGIDDLKIPPDKSTLISQAHVSTRQIDQQNSAGSLTSVEKSQCLIDTWNQTSDYLRQSAINNFRTTNSVNPVYMMAFSGARGNVSQVRQLVAMRGLMADPQGAILEFPIQSNFREGLTITEYLISCYGARKGLVDTALRTATSGYLTRRLVDSAQHVVVSMIDCQTNRGIVLQGDRLEKRLLGRVLSKPVFTKASGLSGLDLKDFKLIKDEIWFERNHIMNAHTAFLISNSHTQVLVRSPLTCAAATSICQLCYGWNLASGKLVHIGEAVGVIAAQSIGEPGTQLTMRTFHTGGVGVLSDQALKRIDAPYIGKIIFPEPLPGKFIRTPHGKIAYMVKYSHLDPDRIIFKLKPDEEYRKDFIVREHDFPSGSLLFVKHTENVQTGQLLAQASRVKLTKQTLPESSHPVYSTLEGQVFFESMPLLETIEVTLNNKKSKKEEKSFALLPPKRTLSKLGSFWVLSGKNQQDIHTANCFVEPGDLISQQSLLFKYQFYSIGQAQLKNIKKISGFITVFGVPVFQIPTRKVQFVRTAYKLFLTKEFPQKNSSNFQEKLIYQPHSLSKSFLIWYFATHNYCPSNTYFYAESQIPQVQKRFSIQIKDKKQWPLWHESSIPLTIKNDLIYTHVGELYTQYHNLLSYSGDIDQSNSFDLKANSTNFIKATLFYITFPSESATSNFIKKSTFQFKSDNKLVFSDFKKFQSNKSFHSGSQFLTVSLRGLYSTDISNVELKTNRQNNGQAWFYIPTSKVFFESDVFDKNESSFSFTEHRFLPTGLCLEKVCFPKHQIIFDVIPKKKLRFKKFKSCQFLQKQRSWYSQEKLVQTVSEKHRPQKFIKDYILSSQYKINNADLLIDKSLVIGLSWYNLSKITANKSLILGARERDDCVNSIYYGIKFQVSIEYSLPDQKMIHNQWCQYLGKIAFNSTNSPISTKQLRTKFQCKTKTQMRFQRDISLLLRWNSLENLMRIRCLVLNNDLFPRLSSTFQHNSIKINRGLEIFAYQFSTLKKINTLGLQTYSNNWIISSQPFGIGCVKAGTSGEVRLKKSQLTGTFKTILRNPDVFTLQFTKSSGSRIGKFFRWGDELFPGVVSTYNGQVIKQTISSITLRMGISVLASTRGVVHICHNELIKKNQLLITLKSRRLQTEDIVQGIPKIEQLFEARESQGGEIIPGTVHSHLKNSFIRELESASSKFLAQKQTSIEQRHQAVQKSMLEAQHFLVENIIDAYSNQGVSISEKHVEVIVRQMSSRVRIVTGGETGLLPGELVQYEWVQRFNERLRDLGLLQATYEPIILGISKSVLQSDSFLLAASFQEVSRVLVRSALSKKRDFLRGLHENVIVGQLIPAGTGLVVKTSRNFNLNEEYNSNALLT